MTNFIVGIISLTLGVVENPLFNQDSQNSLRRVYHDSQRNKYDWLDSRRDRSMGSSDYWSNSRTCVWCPECLRSGVIGFEKTRGGNTPQLFFLN
jgi:hypothetical protein